MGRAAAAAAAGRQALEGPKGDCPAEYNPKVLEFLGGLEAAGRR